MWLLKSYSNPLPNNYVYEQNGHSFKANPIIEEVVKDVSNFRIANNLPRASLSECLEDVDCYNCAIRKNDGRFCWDSPESFERIHKDHRFVKQNCAGCGTVVTQN